MAICKKCSKDIVNNDVMCKFCNCSYHKRCVYGNVNDDLWMCFNCTGNLFPFNHILDDNEFRYSLNYFNNSIEYNRLLNLKLNPFVFDDLLIMTVQIICLALILTILVIISLSALLMLMYHLKTIFLFYI